MVPSFKYNTAIAHVFIEVVALCVSLTSVFWFGRLCMFNWWAADGPSSTGTSTFRARGDWFFVLTILCLALTAFVLHLIWKSIARWRKWQQQRGFEVFPTAIERELNGSKKGE
jgi:hypothetical protein